MFQLFQLFQIYVSIVSCGCCKIDRDVAHVAMVVHVCLQAPIPQCFICFLYTYVASVSDAYLKCFICLPLYVASVASGCLKSRSGCCTCCNGVLTVCSKYFICFRCMLHRFYLDVAKVDRGVAQRGQWLSLLLGRSRESTHVAFPYVFTVKIIDF